MVEQNVFKGYAGILEYQGLYPSSKRLSFYLENYLFKDIHFGGKSLVDIGSGRGIYSFFAGFAGAKTVVCIEPHLRGSGDGAIEMFDRLAKRFQLPQVELKGVRFQDFVSEGETFDVILLHNSINHLDEEACANLKTSKEARMKYVAIFKRFEEISHTGTKLVIADCSRYNFFGLLRLENPLAPTIEWHRHQSPYFWCRLLKEFDFVNPRIRWTTPSRLCKIFFGNPVASYFLISHFVLTLTKL